MLCENCFLENYSKCFLLLHMRILAVLILFLTLCLHFSETIELLHHDSAEICCIDTCCGHADEDACCDNGEPCNPFDNCSHCIGFIHSSLTYSDCAIAGLSNQGFPPTIISETEVFMPFFRPPCNI